ncbi:MAG: transcriptional repressor LexA [Firmicutes bacterium]|nr:transcriptional repressor LexA [Bacillota bacterium]
MSAKGDARRQQIAEYVAQYVRRHGYPPTVREIAHAVGLRSVATVARHLAVMEAQGQLSHQPMTRRSWRLAQSPALAAVEVPVLGRITAGAPILAQNHIEDYWALPAGLFRPPADFLLRVKGDSMIEAGIWDGDWVAVHSQDYAQDGEIVIALVGEEATVKRLERRSGEPPRLLPANPAYAPIEGVDFIILGRVVGLMRTW